MDEFLAMVGIGLCFGLALGLPVALPILAAGIFSRGEHHEETTTVSIGECDFHVCDTCGDVWERTYNHRYCPQCGRLIREEVK